MQRCGPQSFRALGATSAQAPGLLAPIASRSTTFLPTTWTRNLANDSRVELGDYDLGPIPTVPRCYSFKPRQNRDPSRAANEEPRGHDQWTSPAVIDPENQPPPAHMELDRWVSQANWIRSALIDPSAPEPVSNLEENKWHLKFTSLGAAKDRLDTALHVIGASKNLLEEDFRRILPESKHIPGWRSEGGLLKGKTHSPIILFSPSYVPIDLSLFGPIQYHSQPFIQ